MTDTTTSAILDEASEKALAVRTLYETIEQHVNGKTWSLHELMLGFSNDVGQVGRLILANDGTWPIDGDVHAELQHKLAESIWWAIVLANKLDIDISDAYSRTMDTIQSGLTSSVERISS